jgi:hypothetical protein
MKPIKCLPLLAAVLAFAARNADASLLDEQERAFVASVDAEAAKSELKPSQYVLMQDQNDKVCWDFSNMGFEYCVWCCIVHSYDYPDEGVMLAVPFVYATYGGLCVCEEDPEDPGITPEEYKAAKNKLKGELIHRVARDKGDNRKRKRN